MTAPDLSQIEQMSQPDIRGWLCINNLPNELQHLEDGRAAADLDMRKRTFERPATDTERLLLDHLGYGPIPDDLTTTVHYFTTSVRQRRWPALEPEEP